MKIGNKEFNLGERTYIMGILNVTPDSFSDGGKYNEVEEAVKHAKELVDAGADIIDIGGESTRPGALYVTEDEEIERVVPIIKAIKENLDITISIDTYKSKTAEAAIKAGADIINDVWGFKKDKDMAKVAAKYKVPCILMHNREEKPYKNLMEDVLEEVVGEIYDEHDEEEQLVTKKSDTLYEAKADIDLDELFDIMDIDLDIPEDAYSLGSWMYSKIEDIPDICDMYQYHHLVFTIIEVEDRRIKKVKIEVLPEVEKEE